MEEEKEITLDPRTRYVNNSTHWRTYLVHHGKTVWIESLYYGFAFSHGCAYLELPPMHAGEYAVFMNERSEDIKRWVVCIAARNAEQIEDSARIIQVAAKLHQENLSGGHTPGSADAREN